MLPDALPRPSLQANVAAILPSKVEPSVVCMAQEVERHRARPPKLQTWASVERFHLATQAHQSDDLSFKGCLAVSLDCWRWRESFETRKLTSFQDSAANSAANVWFDKCGHSQRLAERPLRAQSRQGNQMPAAFPFEAVRHQNTKSFSSS